MKIIDKLRTLFIRRKRAKALGVIFTRASEWTLPDSICLQGQKVSIKGSSDIGTRLAFLDIFLDDCYGLQKLKTKSIRTILDIGGHAGLFSLYGRSLFPEAVIHCYEPNSAMKPFITHQSSTGNFSFFPEAVGLNAGKISLQTHDDSVQTRTTQTESGTISMIPFRECLQRIGGKADILKLDCEGAEWEILKEDISIWKNIQYLCMEYHLVDGHTTEEIRSMVTQIGFEITHQEQTGKSWGLIHAYRK